MTSNDCMDRAISAPDLDCPLCGKMMPVWVWGETPIHICSKCNLISFEMDDLEALSKLQEVDDGMSQDISEACGEVPGTIKHLMKSGLDLYHCPGSTRVYAVDKTADLDGIMVGRTNCKLHSEKLNQLGQTYDQILNKLIL